MGNIAIYKDNPTPKRDEVYKGKSFDAYVQELANDVDDPSFIEDLIKLTKADIHSIKRQTLLTPELKKKLTAAQSEVLEQYYQRKRLEARKRGDTKEERRAFAEANYHYQIAKIKRKENLTIDDDGKKESIFKYPTPTHRCSVQAALGILQTGGIVSFAKRGVNFKAAGLGADYGFITFLAKGKEVEILEPNAPMPSYNGRQWNYRYKHPNSVHKMAGVIGKSKADDIPENFQHLISQGVSSEQLAAEVQRKSCNWHDQAEIPACLAAQYNVGIRDEERAYFSQRIDSACRAMGKQANEVTGFVPAEALGAVVIPNFLLKFPAYQQISELAQQRGIQVIVSDTGTVFDYLGDSLSYFFLNKDHDYAMKTLDGIGPYVAAGLSEYFGQTISYDTDRKSQLYRTFQGYLKKYMMDKGMISPSANEATFAQDVFSENKQRGLNRGSWFSGNYLNTVGEQAYIQEQEIYFNYMAIRERQAALAEAA